VAFSFVLLIGAGLFLRSLQKAQEIDPGFYTGPAALLWPMPNMSGYETVEEGRAFIDAFEARLLAHPSIAKVGMTDAVPLGTTIQSWGYLLPGVPSQRLDGVHDIDHSNVAPGYFDAMDIEVVRGRAFEESDVEGVETVFVNEAFVNRCYPGENLVGRSIESSAGTPIRIIGITATTKIRPLGEEPWPAVYQLHGQLALGSPQVIVRGTGTSAEHAVSKRPRELGIRMALGASAGDVVRMAIGGGMRLVAVGGAIGVGLAAAVTWSISGFLYGIGSADLATFGAIPLILAAVALLAAFVPARRASTVDPVQALRTD
jgi:putative ABC transport system permease protein